MIGVVVFFVLLFAVIYLECQLFEWEERKSDSPFVTASMITGMFGIPAIAIANFLYILDLLYGPFAG